MFTVKIITSSGDDSIVSFPTIEEAEKAIEEDLIANKNSLADQGINYDYGDFYAITELWECGGDFYIHWIRLWLLYKEE